MHPTVNKAMITEAGRRSFAEVGKVARKGRMDVQKAAHRFAMERFLHRIFTGEHAGRFALKGGMLMMFAEEAPDQYRARTTNDVDLQVPAFDEGMAAFSRMVTDALSRVPEDDDGVRFDVSQMRVEFVREFVPGCAVSVPTYVGTVKFRLKADVTFDERSRVDELVAAEVPSMVPGMPSVSVARIPFEHTVADKVQAMVRHGAVTFRLRDYYDLYAIFLHGKATDLDAAALAMGRTFRLFDMPVPEDVSEIVALSDESARLLAPAWEKELAARPFYVETPPFPEMLALIREGVAPILERVDRDAAPAPF